MTIPTPPGPRNSDPQPGDQQPGGQHPGSGGPGYPPPGQPSNPYGQPQGQPSAGQPQGQPSAGQPHGQPSAGQPQGPPSAGNPHGQPSAGQPQQPWNQPGGQPYGQPGHAAQPGQQQWGQSGQPPQGQPPQGQPPQGQAPGQGQPPYGGGQQPRKSFMDANPLKAAFDFSFNSYATPGLVKIIYILAVVLGAISWIGGAISWFVIGAAAESAGGGLVDTSGAGAGPVVLGVLQLILGWIPVLLWLLLVRVVLEAGMALVRAAEDVRAMRSKIDV